MTDKPLTEKQEAFALGLAEGLNPYQAGIRAGYKSTSGGAKALQDERVREALKASVMRAGLTVEKIGDKLSALSDAQRFELSRNGDPVHLGPDNRAQLQAMDIVIKMLGGYPNPRLEIDQSTQNVLVIDSAKQPLAALDPFASVDAESVQVLDAPSQKTDWNPEGGIAKEDDFVIG